MPGRLPHRFHRSCRCWDGLEQKQRGLRGGNVPGWTDPARLHRGEISGKPGRPGVYPRPYTPRPCRRPRASPARDIEKLSDRARAEALLPQAAILGGEDRQVNATEMAEGVSDKS